MKPTGDRVFRTVRTIASIGLCVAAAACDREPSAPDAGPGRNQTPLQHIARARVIEPGDEGRIPSPPAVDAWSRTDIADILNMAFDDQNNRFVIFESSTNELLDAPAGLRGAVDRGTARRVDARRLGIRSARGLTVDPQTGRLFILDVGPRIVRFDRSPAGDLGDPNVRVIDLPAELSNVRGIAFDPTSGNLHALDPKARVLYELDQQGRIVARRDLSRFKVGDPAGMAIGPTADATDDPSAKSVYIKSGGVVTEFSLAASIQTTTTTASATLLRSTATSEFSPPSPDAAGVAYAAHLGQLVITDSEVDEMTIYAGANVFETTLSGTLNRTWTTTSFSYEPTGAAYDPVSRVLFISDDDRTEVYMVAPGPDGQYGTSDDAVSSFDTKAFGSVDPEGIAYDVAQGVLYIVDGVNSEVYRVSPGANGIFDGIPPAGDDEVTSFDTEVHGLTDPEGIAYDSDYGHLYVVGHPTHSVFHFSTTGTLLRTVSISAASPHNPAGLEYAPSSGGPSVKALYVVDRGVDNNGDPDENDGRMFEFSLPPFDGNGLPSVTITAPANGSNFIQGDAITFSGTASDTEDGDLTSSLSWTSSIDGALGTGGSLTIATLSLGTHTITASVTDSDGGFAAASIAVTVNDPGAGVVDVRISTGVDDVEEAADGKVYRGSSDLELVNDGTDQTVGLRFNGIEIPPGATITGAYVQFQVDERTSEPTSLTIAGQASDNAGGFTTATGNVSSRSRTVSTVSWSPPEWATVGVAGTAQRTPNIAPVIQEIISQSGWRSGNSLVIIITGTGRRVAEAYEGVAAGAPLLHVDYTTGPNTVPTATNVVITGTPQVGQVLTGSYTYSDAEGDPQGASTYRWLRNGVAIAGATAQSYMLVTDDQDAMIVFEVTPVAQTGESPGAPAQSDAVGPVAAAPPNTVPVASNVTISGTAQVTKTLTGNYTYSDADGDAEGESTYRWLRDGTAISGATGRTYTLVTADQGAMIVFEVTPVAVTGASPGEPVQSAAVGPVAEAPTTSQIVHTLLTSGNDPANQKVYTTASIAPAPNALVTIAVMGHRAYGAPASPAISGGGMSQWTEVGTVTFDALSLPLKRMTVYRAMSSSPGSGAITISFSQNLSNAQWIVSQWEGVDQSGTNGSGAIVQVGSTAADEVNGLTQMLASFGDANNVAYGVFGVRSSVPAVTPGAGFTEIAEHGSGESPPGALQAQRSVNDNTIDATWTNLRGAVIGIEIKAGQAP